MRGELDELCSDLGLPFWDGLSDLFLCKRLEESFMLIDYFVM